MIKKNRIKLSLIDDYIKIITMKNFLNNSFDDVEISSTSSLLLEKLQKANNKLENVLEKLLTCLNLKDSSFAILKTELEQNNKLFEFLQIKHFKNLEQILSSSYFELHKIDCSLNDKASALHINLMDIS